MSVQFSYVALCANLVSIKKEGYRHRAQ